MESLLKRLSLTKKQLSEDLGYSHEQVSRWGNNPPKHVMSYLELLLQYRIANSLLKDYETRLEKIREIV